MNAIFFRRALLFLLLFAGGCSPLYVLRAGYEEAKILSRRQSIAKLVRDERTPPETYNLGTVVSDFERIVRTEIGRATIIGMSFGGFVSLRFAAEHPELVDKLVVLISAHRFSAEGRGKLSNQFAWLKEGNFYELLKENAVLFRRPWYNWLVRLMLWKDKGRLASQFNPADSILRGYQGLFSEGFERTQEYARRVKADTLILGGTADQYFDVEAFTETGRLIPSARVELFDHETHMLPLERGADVARVLSSFLTG